MAKVSKLMNDGKYYIYIAIIYHMSPYAILYSLRKLCAQ